MPAPLFTGFDSNGNPISGGKLCVYVDGTSTPVDTYTDTTLATPNSNPVLMNSAGRAPVFLRNGLVYKFVLRARGSSASECTTGAIQWTADGIGAVPPSSTSLDVLGTAGEALTAGQVVYLSNGSGSLTAGRWYKADADLTYASANAITGIVPASIGSGAVGSLRLAGSAPGTALTIGTMYYVSGTAGALTSTPTGRVVGVADTTTSLVLIPNTLKPTVVLTTATGTQHNFNPGIVGDTVVRATGASALTITGFPAGVDGQRLRLISDVGQVSLTNADAASSSGNRILTISGGTMILGGGQGSADFIYIAGALAWRMVQFEQGQPITFVPTWGNSGTANTLTGSSISGAYYVAGQQITFHFQLSFGSGTASGNGNWTFTYPRTLSSFDPTSTSVRCAAYDDSATSWYSVASVPISATGFYVATIAAPMVILSATVPFIWAINDTLICEGMAFIQ